MSVPNLGDFAAGATVYVPWNTTAVAGGSITLGTDGTLKVYRLPSLTQRTSAAGITFIEDYDTAGIGRHLVAIDLSNDADVGFYAAHGDFGVALDAMGIDGETVNAWIALFSIENRSALRPTVAGETLGLEDGVVTANLTAQAITDDWAASQRTLSPGGVTDIANAVATALAAAFAAIPDAVWDEIVDGILTARQSLRLKNAADGGKLSGVPAAGVSGTVVVRDPADTKNRISAAVDGNGNRTAVTLDLT